MQWLFQGWLHCSVVLLEYQTWEYLGRKRSQRCYRFYFLREKKSSRLYYSFSLVSVSVAQDLFYQMFFYFFSTSILITFTVIIRFFLPLLLHDTHTQLMYNLLACLSTAFTIIYVPLCFRGILQYGQYLTEVSLLSLAVTCPGYFAIQKWVSLKG